jgi:hypothetical protein
MEILTIRSGLDNDKQQALLFSAICSEQTKIKLESLNNYDILKKG